MQEVGFSFTETIVRRLRISFFTISVILASAIAVGLIQMWTVQTSMNNLFSSSFPVFSKAEEIERSQKELLILVQKLGFIVDAGELDAIAQEMKRQLSLLRQKTEFFSLDGPTKFWATKMDGTLSQAEVRISDILKSKRILLKHSSMLDGLITDLRQSRVIIHALLENLSVEESDLGQNDDVQVSVDMIEQRFQRALVRATTITAITLEIDAITELTESMRNIPNATSMERAENALRFKFRGLAVLLGRLEENDTRVKLASEIVHIRSHIFSETGILFQVLQLLEFQTLIEQQIIEKYELFQKISELSFEISENARQRVDGSRQNLDHAKNHMVMALILYALITTTTIGCTIIFVVEKQINQRMPKLTKAVVAIAGGQTDYEVNVFGSDELGKMAMALETFKLNASELRRSNQELEKFAYVAAHDLRSPLRAIQDLAEWTLEDTDTVFSADGQENMALLQRRVARLNQLLTDLLEYSRAGKEEGDLATVSFADIISEVAEMLDPEGKFDIRFLGPVESLMTYSTPLRHIMLNLVSNAIKHHDKTSGSIQITATPNRGQVTFKVTDDGPGISPNYHQRIFGLFQTLRPRDEVEGSGLGLAIIQKLVEHHGGSIRVDSDPGIRRGTSFIFEFPNKTEEQNKTRQAA